MRSRPRHGGHGVCGRALARDILAMPTLTLTIETLAILGASRAHLIPTMTLEGRGLLEAHLVSHGFDMARAIRVVELPSGEGFVITQ